MIGRLGRLLREGKMQSDSVEWVEKKLVEWRNGELESDQMKLILAGVITICSQNISIAADGIREVTEHENRSHRN